MKISFAFFHRIILAALLFNLHSCRQETKQSSFIDPGFTSYISAFTSGYISTQATLRIRLAEDYPEKISTPLGKKVFQFSPPISGSAYWLDQNTIEQNFSLSQEGLRTYDPKNLRWNN